MIEHVFFTIEQVTQRGVGIPTGILDDEEWEEHEEIENLQTCKLTVLSFLYSNQGGAYIYMFHNTHNALNCMVIAIFCEKTSQI